MADLAGVARQLAVRCRDAPGTEGINLLHASGRPAQQSVPHLHLLARREEDGLEAWPSMGGTKPALEAVASPLRDAPGTSASRNPGSAPT